MWTALLRAGTPSRICPKAAGRVPLRAPASPSASPGPHPRRIPVGHQGFRYPGSSLAVEDGGRQHRSQQRMALERRGKRWNRPGFRLQLARPVGVFVGSSTTTTRCWRWPIRPPALSVSHHRHRSSIIASRVVSLLLPASAVVDWPSAPPARVHWSPSTKASRRCAPESDVVLAGGVNRHDHPMVTIAGSTGWAACSPDSRIKVVQLGRRRLRPLREERRHGGTQTGRRRAPRQRRGSWPSSPGPRSTDSRSGGVLAPNPDAQAEVPPRLRDAGIDPRLRRLHRAHGTGTICIC